jgi:hypothetical protein
MVPIRPGEDKSAMDVKAEKIVQDVLTTPKNFADFQAWSSTGDRKFSQITQNN